MATVAPALPEPAPAGPGPSASAPASPRSAPGPSSSSSPAAPHPLRQQRSFLQASHAALVAVVPKIVRLSQNAVLGAYVLVAIAAAGVLWQLISQKAELHVYAWAVAALFVGIAVPLSVHEMHMHWVHDVSHLQRHYVRILFMVPVFCVDAWLALRFDEVQIFLNTAKDCYEAFAIYSFYMLLVEFLGPPERTLALLSAKSERTGKVVVHMLPPFCCVRPWRLDHEFLLSTRILVAQFVVVRLLTAAAVFVGSFTGHFTEGAWTNFADVFIWSVILINVSQILAMWALIMVYHELYDELQALNPLPKFLAIKLVVFVSFWQSIIISGLAFVNVIKPTLDYTKDEIGIGLQDFCICIEMAVASIAHRYCYSSRDFWRGEGVPAPMSEFTHGARPKFAELELALANRRLHLRSVLTMQAVGNAAHDASANSGLAVEGGASTPSTTDGAGAVPMEDISP